MKDAKVGDWRGTYERASLGRTVVGLQNSWGCAGTSDTGAFGADGHCDEQTDVQLVEMGYRGSNCSGCSPDSLHRSLHPDTDGFASDRPLLWRSHLCARHRAGEGQRNHQQLRCSYSCMLGLRFH
jgi:hypothetical protein